MPRIAVIDDDPDVLGTVTRVLHSEGYEVMTAVDGNQGVQLIQAERPDLILCDVSMPLLDGYGVFQSVKSDLRTRTIPFVFITADGTRSEQRKGMEMGVDDYLVKPFSPKELLSCIRTQIKKHHSIVDSYETTLRMMRKNIIYALPHELRTPLSQIIGYAGLLEMQNEPLKSEIINQYGSNIIRASERLEQLIENYLVYAQIEIVASSPDELAKLRNHIVDHIAPIIENTYIERAAHYDRINDIQFECSDHGLRISEGDLTKIMRELLDNALKFSLPQSVVDVQTRKLNDMLQIIIRDCGRGMSADQVNLLGAYMQFDRSFYEQQGLGLGFVIAKRLIELHRGTIKIDSQINVGTTVVVEFPI